MKRLSKRLSERLSERLLERLAEDEASPAAARRPMMPLALRRCGAVVLDLLLPPQCAVCRSAVGSGGRLCAACWQGLGFITAPRCAACGLPFTLPAAPGTLCGACLRSPPRFARARAALAYDDASRPLLVGFKHADRTELAGLLAGWMAIAGRDLLPDADAVVPVPLHRWRLLARRYNQSVLLARALARIAGKPLLPDALRRVRATPSQGGLSRSARATNVSGAFRLTATARSALAGRRVLLVDDVLTTGATVDACTRALLAGGARAVDVLTVARVVRPSAGDI